MVIGKTYYIKILVYFYKWTKLSCVPLQFKSALKKTYISCSF